VRRFMHWKRHIVRVLKSSKWAYVVPDIGMLLSQTLQDLEITGISIAQTLNTGTI